MILKFKEIRLHVQCRGVTSFPWALVQGSRKAPCILTVQPKMIVMVLMDSSYAECLSLNEGLSVIKLRSISLSYSGVQRGCGRCDGPGHPACGASNGPVFVKKLRNGKHFRIWV